MRRHVDVRLVDLHVLQGLLRGQRREEIRRQRDQGEVDAADPLHHRFLLVRHVSAAVTIHDAEAVIEGDEIGDGAFPDDARIR